MNVSSVKFSKNHNAEFYKVLRQRVSEYFKTQSKTRHANANMVIKTVFMIALYLTPFILMLTLELNNWIQIGLWAMMGFGMAGIGLSIMHDANHGAYSRRKSVNTILGYLLNVVGGSDVNWRIQHNVLHHTYTNVTGMDEDINPGKVMRFSPHEKRHKHHKYQHLYAWFLYGLMTLMWLMVKDYRQIARYQKKGLIQTQGAKFSNVLTIIIVSKVLYMGMVLVLPFIFSSAPWYIIILGFLLMHFIAGVALGMIFQPAHVVPSSDYPLPDESGNIMADWAVSQLYNTANFAPKARIFSWYVGGLNYQVEHHLFPNICHVHYPKLSEIVKNTAEEYNLPYNSFRTFRKALREHARMLYNLGNYDNAPGLH